IAKSKPEKTPAVKKPAPKPIVKSKPVKPAPLPPKKPAPKTPVAKTPAPKTPVKPTAPKAPPPVVPAKPVATKKAVAPAKPAAPAKPYFKPDEIKGFKNALLALLRQLVSRVNQQLDDALPIVDKINIEEDGTEAFDRVVGLEQAGLDQAKINKIREALSAIENGTYGLCQECGCKIAIVRLKALPFAYTCVECQNKLDNPNGEKSRFVDLLD
ncbi:MAG: TraR/DksA family transcriptional regulator, partial [Kiritimatiellaeota bacterium]|nr:TraR/DksA family transcriptional regulator [Kiritimatiellota bacterium]